MSGRPDFDVGDLVVCVDDGPSKSLAAMGTPVSLVKMRAYRVSELQPPGIIGRFDYTDWAVMVQGALSPVHPRGFAAYRFRKIDKAADDWAAEWEACKPKERVA